MASGTLSTRPQAEKVPAQGRYEEFIEKRLEHTRRQVRLGDVAVGLMLLAIASLLFFLAAAVLDHWVFKHGLNFIARFGLLAVWIGGAGAYVWRFLVPPLANQINPVFAAQTIEQGRPTLKNSLINFLLLRAHPQEVAPVVYRALEHRAAADLLKVPVDHAMDRSRVIHLASVLAGVVAVFALYLALSPKNPLISAARVLWPWSSMPAPTRVHVEDVRPGDGVVFNDEHQEISAEINGLRDGEEVALWFSTADGQVVDDRLVMTRIDDTNRYRCDLPPGSGGFQQDTSYRITAGDATTQNYKLEVQIAPTIMVDRIDYHFPEYTEKPDRTVKNQGDIKALEGTRVTIHAAANMDIKEARIDLGCEGLRSLPMTVDGRKASGQFPLALDPDGRKAQYDHYQILFTGINGQAVRRPIRYRIDVDPDFPPEIKIVQPTQKEVAVPADGQLPIRVHASDPDFALRYVTLRGEHAGQELVLRVLLDRTKPAKALARHFEDEYIFRPADLKLKTGDQIAYWATAADNKEPHPNQSSSEKRTIVIGPAGQSGQPDPQNTPKDPDGQPQPNQDKSEQGRGEPDKADPAKSDSARNADGSKDGDRTANNNPKKGANQDKPQDPQHGNEPGQGDNNPGQGRQQSSSDPSKAKDSGEQNAGEAGDEPKKLNSETQKTDVIKKSLDDLEKEKNQQNQSDQSSGEKKDQQQNSGQQDGNNSQGSPQGGQDQTGTKGGGQQQGNSDKSKDQGGTGTQQAQDGNPSPQGGKPDAGGSQQSGSRAQSGQENSNSQGDKKSQQGNSGGSPHGDAQPQGGTNSGNQSSSNQTSPQNNSGQGDQKKPSAGSKDGQGPGGQPKSDSKPNGGESSQQNGSTGSGQKPEKQQSGATKGNDDSGGGDPSKSQKQPGSKGGGDEAQSTQGGLKPNDANNKKPSGSSGSDSPIPLGGQKPGSKPKEESSNSSGDGQGSQPKKEEKQGGGGKSEGGQQPKSGQGDKEGSNGGGSKPRPGGDQGGTADGQHQQDPGKTGDPTAQDSHGAPAPQVDPERAGNKTGDAHEGLNPNPDKPQSPGNSPHDSNSTSQSPGDRKGGGGAGGGQPAKNAGKGTPGTQTAAESGGSVSNEKGGDATGTKAGDQVRAGDRTGSPHKEPGKGDGEKKQPADAPAPKDNSQNPQGNATQNSANSQDKSSGGQAGAQSSQQAGTQGAGQPAGGSLADRASAPPPSHEPEGEPEAANLEFSKKQVDLALQHLSNQINKEKPELLDRLGWTKDEARKFVENMRKLQDSARRPGSEGEAGKKAYNEFLKNLDLRPHGTRLQGGRTRPDDLRGVRDSGQTQPPSEWADIFHAYSHSTAEK